jgi:hypothetical protein
MTCGPASSALLTSALRGRHAGDTGDDWGRVPIRVVASCRSSASPRSTTNDPGAIALSLPREEIRPAWRAAVLAYRRI